MRFRTEFWQCHELGKSVVASKLIFIDACKLQSLLPANFTEFMQFFDGLSPKSKNKKSLGILSSEGFLHFEFEHILNSSARFASSVCAGLHLWLFWFSKTNLSQIFSTSGKTVTVFFLLK